MANKENTKDQQWEDVKSRMLTQITEKQDKTDNLAEILDTECGDMEHVKKVEKIVVLAANNVRKSDSIKALLSESKNLGDFIDKFQFYVSIETLAVSERKQQGMKIAMAMVMLKTQGAELRKEAEKHDVKKS